MNKIAIVLFSVLVFTFSIVASASAHSGHLGEEQVINEAENAEEISVTEEHISLDEVLPQILTKYNAETIQDLECEKVSEEDFEKIGDGVMESMHPGEAHTTMDKMMGDEGSVSLKSAHINMGRNYLGCDSGGVQSFGMMGSNFNGSMMTGFNGSNNLLSLALIANSILLTVLLVVLIKYFWKKGGGKK